MRSDHERQVDQQRIKIIMNFEQKRAVAAYRHFANEANVVAAHALVLKLMCEERVSKDIQSFKCTH